MEKVRSGPRDLSSYKHLQCLKVNWQLWRSSALEIHGYSQSFGEKLFRSKVLKISKHHGMMIEPMSTNPKRIVCWSFGAFGQHRFFFFGEASGGCWFRVQTSTHQPLPKNISIPSNQGQRDKGSDPYVLGSKLPLFPYNRGWSSTQ